MKFGVVIFPGSNCDKDIICSIQNTTGKNVVELWHKNTDLKNCDVIFLPGGFSFGDYLRSGAIAKFSPIMSKIIDFANNGGYLIGICNGKNLDAVNNVRIQRMLSKTLGYEFRVLYMEGKVNLIADALSRSTMFAAEKYDPDLVCSVRAAKLAESC